MNATPNPLDLPLVFLQPVVDSRHTWTALLLDSPTPLDGDSLTRLFGEYGLFEALDSLACIVSCDRPNGLHEACRQLPAERMVLKLPVAAGLHPDHCADMARLQDAGFRLLADGLPPAGRELCAEIGAVALAGPDTPPANLDSLVKRAGNHLALGVDTPQSFVRAREAGFRWFAGTYPLHPDGEPLPRGTIRHALLLQLLTLIARDADSHDIEVVIKQDAHLSYQLLKLVNSVAFSLSTKINSFSQAITLLGRRQLQRWLQLLLYARPEVEGRSPLMPRAALRGALMEALCSGREAHDRAFMAGVLSLLDVFLGMNMAEIVTPLNLAEDVSAALLDRSGNLGGLLRIVEASEAGDAEGLSAALAAAGIDRDAWTGALIKAHRWAIRVSLEA